MRKKESNQTGNAKLRKRFPSLAIAKQVVHQVGDTRRRGDHGGRGALFVVVVSLAAAIHRCEIVRSNDVCR